MTKLLGLLLLVLLLVPSPAHAYSPEQGVILDIVTEAADRYQVSADLLTFMAWCESRFDPKARGRAGERGLMQLHPRGLLPHFHRSGYTDPDDPVQAADYAGWAVGELGLGPHWSCWRVYMRGGHA